MVIKIREYTDNNITKLFGLAALFILTIEVHKSEVERRVSMGYRPEWGGEILIIPLGLLIYYLIKSFRESLNEFRRKDWYV